MKREEADKLAIAIIEHNRRMGLPTKPKKKNKAKSK